jgi:uridylate kinase
MASTPVRRILLKLSGESLAGGAATGYDGERMRFYGEQLAELHREGIQVGIVLGGGNLFRGARGHGLALRRVTGDQMGMLATLMNALAMRDLLGGLQVPAEVMASKSIEGLCGAFDAALADRLLADGKMLVFGGGTGNPYFTTDTAASLRAVEIGADLLIKATQVDGVYSADPKTDPNARFLPRLTYHQVLMDRLGVMDLTAIALCQDNRLPLRVLSMEQSGALRRAIAGQDVGSLVSDEA